MGGDHSTQIRQVSLDDKYALDATRAYMTGIEALVRLPMLQHQRDELRGLNTAAFVSGYRGSPLGTVDQAMWKAGPWLEKHNIHFQPGLNEDLAATAVWGSQQTNLFAGARYDGVFGMWYGKGPGVDRSMDVIKHANAFGTSKYGGVLAVVGDDHACKSSTLPHQSDHMFVGATCPVLNPAGVQELLDLGVYGWELSRYSGCWVGLKAIAETMDSSASIEVDPARSAFILPEDLELPPGRLAVSGDIVARDADMPGGRRQQAGNAVDGRRLAGTVRPEQAEHLPGRGLDTDAVGRCEIAVLFDQVRNDQHRSSVFFLSAVGEGPILPLNSSPTCGGSALLL